nr:transposase [Corticibacter populi]
MNRMRKPRCWMVERSFAWLEKIRRPWKNCERLLDSSLPFVHLAFLALLLERSQARSRNASRMVPDAACA